MLLATTRPCSPLLDQLQQQQQHCSVAKGPGSDMQQQKQLRRNNLASSSSSASSQQQGSLLAAVAAGFKSASAAGLPVWQAHVRWFDDPFGLPEGQQVSNEVCTTVKVQVVQAEML